MASKSSTNAPETVLGGFALYDLKDDSQDAQMGLEIAYRTSKTYPTMEEVRAELTSAKMANYIAMALATKNNIAIEGPPGCGKTTCTLQTVKMAGKTVLLRHGPTADPDQDAVPFAYNKEDGRGMRHVVQDQIREADVIIIDEPNRIAEAYKRNSLMEMMQNKTFAGQPLKKDVVFILLTNPSAGSSGVVSKGTDLAFQSRVGMSISVSQADIPWKLALASKYNNTDLSKVFDIYDRLEGRFPGVTERLAPRTLDHVILCTLEGLPSAWGLPSLAGEPHKLKDNDNRDVTREILDEISQALVGRPALDPTDMKYVSAALTLAISKGLNLMIEGLPGIGKTEYVKELISKAEQESQYYSLQNFQPDNYVNIDLNPQRPEDGLRYLIHDELNRDTPFNLIADEYWRAQKNVQNMMLEVSGNRTLAGQKLKIKALIAMTNPRMIEGVRQDVGLPDFAMADRFHITIRLQPGAIDAYGYLAKKYGERATQFIEWHREDIDAIGRLYCPPRSLDFMIEQYWHYIDNAKALPALTASEVLQDSLPKVGEERVPVPLTALKARLRDNPIVGIKAILADVDGYFEQLAKRDPLTLEPENMQVHTAVANAINSAEESIIADPANADALVKIIAPLNHDLAVSLIRADGEQKRKALVRIFPKAVRARKELGIVVRQQDLDTKGS